MFFDCMGGIIRVLGLGFSYKFSYKINLKWGIVNIYIIILINIYIYYTLLFFVVIITNKFYNLILGVYVYLF